MVWTAPHNGAVDLAVIALTFGAIFVVELPDKTFLATLVLSTRYRPLLVWIGVGLAFAVQTTVAVLLGHAASFLPDTAVKALALVMFLIGAVILFREGRAHHQAAEDEFADKAKPAQGWRAILASFLVLFAAEWGDLSQLLTLTLVARYDDPRSVFVGALGALLMVSGLACLVGRALLRWISLHVLHYVGSGVCLVLAAVTAYELLR
ncbi:TMEM165/GDT1 family protein [Nocardioides bigeumensis]|uniref:GDT1 family protein n=1 Tax=Nocardioides bigeumensis TaxID=433657 RepID=A0ABN2YWJ4_9ACTN